MHVPKTLFALGLILAATAYAIPAFSGSSAPLPHHPAQNSLSPASSPATAQDSTPVGKTSTAAVAPPQDPTIIYSIEVTGISTSPALTHGPIRISVRTASGQIIEYPAERPDVELVLDAAGVPTLKVTFNDDANYRTREVIEQAGSIASGRLLYTYGRFPRFGLPPPAAFSGPPADVNYKLDVSDIATTPTGFTHDPTLTLTAVDEEDHVIPNPPEHPVIHVGFNPRYHSPSFSLNFNDGGSHYEASAMSESRNEDSTKWAVNHWRKRI